MQYNYEVKQSPSPLFRSAKPVHKIDEIRVLMEFSIMRIINGCQKRSVVLKILIFLAIAEAVRGSQIYVVGICMISK